MILCTYSCRYMYNRAHIFNWPNVGILLKIHHHNIFRDFSNPTKYFTTSDSVGHCFVFDPLRVVRAKLFRIVHSSVTRSFIRGAWRGSCDTSLPRPIISLRHYRRFGPVLRSPYVRSFHYLPLSCKPGPKTV